MEEIPETLLLDIKEENEDLVEYPLPVLDVTATPLTIEVNPSSVDEAINRFCRLCLRSERSALFPLMSSCIKGVSVPDMIRSIARISIGSRGGNLPKSVCIDCAKKLNHAFNIQKEFIESDKVLKGFAKCKGVSLLENLQQYQSRLVPTVDVIRRKVVKKENHVTDLNSDKSNFDKKVKRIPDSEVPSNDTIVGEDKNEIVKKDNLENRRYKEVILDGNKDDNEFIRVCSESSDDEDIKEVEQNGIDKDETTHLVSEITEAESPVTNTSKRRIFRRYNVELKETVLDPKKCYICETVLTDENKLSEHLTSHVDMIPYECQQCIEDGGETKIMKTLILLHRHFRMHASSIKCPQCPYQTSKITNLYGHMNRTHGADAKTEYTCEVCGLKLIGMKKLNRHAYSHRMVDEGRYQCPICEKKFATKTRLTRHQHSHTNEKPYECHICKKTLSNKDNLQKHLRVHTGERGYRCEICGNGFTCSSSLQVHMAALHDIGEKKYPSQVRYSEPKKCEFEGCDFETQIREQYYIHKRKHLLKYHCRFCEKRYSTRQSLISHESLHTGHKQLCCEFCGKGFQRKHQLNEHVNGAHNNVRPYSCETCGASFVRQETLRQHRMKHSETLQFQCRYCERKFRYHCDRNKHERIHANNEAVATKQGEVLDSSAVEGMEIIEVEYVTEYDSNVEASISPEN